MDDLLYSERHAAKADRYSFKISKDLKNRILHTLHQHEPSFGGQYDFHQMLDEVQKELLARKGKMRVAANHTGNHPAIDHFWECPDDEALDFIELCFRTHSLGFHGQPEKVVEKFNRIFESDSVGYELTPVRQVETDARSSSFPFPIPDGRKVYKTIHPQIIKKGERTVHEKAVKPALDILGDPRFATANGEMLKAFEEIRKGDYADAITDCGSAFESVMKTICKEKGWTINPEKDTCAALVKTCQSNGLIEPFYVEMLVGVGRTRSKMGDAHGKAQTPEYQPTSKHAEHMIAMTCSHITFLVQQANI